jgi:hypothetical protein
MSVHGEIDRVIRDLDNCAAVIKAGHQARAINGVLTAISDLKKIEAKVKRLERAAKA